MKRVAFLSYDFRIGGAEKTVVNLIPQFLNAGYRVDLVLMQRSGAFLEQLDPRAELIDLKKRHVSSGLFALAHYLRRCQPDIVISSQTHLNVTAVLARRLSCSRPQLILTEQNTISVNNQSKGGKEGLLVKLARHLYAQADDIVVVSKGAARDLIETIHILPQKVHVIYNPINYEQIRKSTEIVPSHVWLTNKEKPVLIAVGRLTAQKNFSFLLDVFAEVRKQLDCRLIILGEGEDRDSLEAQAQRLKIADDISLPGSFPDPYGYMARADIMICTSLYEGFNIAVAESLACGTPVISVDCPYGPGEILDGGKYGTLLPMNDAAALSTAILNALRNPSLLPARNVLLRRGERFSSQNIFREYEKILRV